MNYKDVLIQNKKVTEADRKMVESVILPTLASKNPSKEELIYGLAGFVFGMQSGYGFGGFSPSVCRRYGITQGKAQQYFDRARYLILKLDSAYYMANID